MKDQKLTAEYDLYDGTPPHEEAATSHQAAEDITEKVSELQERVLAYVRSCGDRGSTDDELFNALGAHRPNTWRPRRRELVLKGYLVDSGYVRPTRSGKNATVWRAVIGG